MDTTKIVNQKRTGIIPVHTDQVLAGIVVVSPATGANPGTTPQDHNDPVYVLIPSLSPDHVYGPCDWTSSKGDTLPQAGNNATVVMDNNHTPVVLDFNGAYTVPSYPPSAVLLPGTLVPAATTTYAGCLLCDGTSYLRSGYPNLFSAIGTNYGAADGTHFNVPDLRGRLPIGAGTAATTPGGSTPVQGATAWSLGNQPASGPGGEQAHAQSVGEMASHGHELATDASGGYVGADAINSMQIDTTYGGDQHNGVASDRYNGTVTSGSALIRPSGSGTAMNILPPVSAINWFILHGN